MYTMIQWILIALTFFSALLHIFLSKKSKPFEIFLLYSLVFLVGVRCSLIFLANLIDSVGVANYVGWPPGNPFQIEVAFVYLAIGILGILCIWFRKGFWLATIFSVTIF